MNFRSIKVQLNLFLAAYTIFWAILEPRFVFVAGLFWAVLFCVLIEGLILLLKTKKFQITASAITSGLILGFVFSAESPWWMFLTVALLTVGLKRLLQFHGKNLLNPAACGIFLASLFLKGATEWNGAYVWYILIPAGLYIVHKIRKLEIVLSYLAVSLLLFVPQAIAQNAPVLGVFGYFNLFFIFIMLIEPKTTPATRPAKIIFGAGVALIVFLLTEWSFRYEPELFALLVLNALTPWINKIPNFKFSTAAKTA
ncbi:MAG TPA: RnfABCDGE type electron transport complex subunit D [Candidatus Omnitrophota bacterium]|nr:RnfABCDGE type electron transport complex subunit D [Candidatus Omnitrophota bacterium]HPS37194.1 RnfABCDGE type electron transport complex subunit D [Candidatus Omnitrophota bacterium]